MNIFYTSIDPYECARTLDDKRVIKMCLESAQLLCSALRLNGVDEPELYKLTHKGHRCTLWAAKSRGNYKWLLLHLKALNSVYVDRYDNGNHKSFETLYKRLDQLAYRIPAGNFSEPPNCACNEELDLDYSNMADTRLAYMLYLDERWAMDKREPTWSGGVRY